MLEIFSGGTMHHGDRPISPEEHTEKQQSLLLTAEIIMYRQIRQT